MTLKEAYQVLHDHQKWRTDNNVPSIYKMQEPSEISKAIKIALKILKVECNKM